MGKLFLLFTVVPLVELYLLVSIGEVLGAAPTIALVLVTGALGAWFARLEGLRVLRRWQQAMARHELPTDTVVDGILIFIGGLLLVTPGVLTDVVGLSLVFPVTRRFVSGAVHRWLKEQVERGAIQVVATDFSRAVRPSGPVIEVEGEVIDITELPPRQG